MTNVPGFRPRCSAKRPIKEGRFPNRPQRRFVNRRSLARKLTALCLISMLRCTRRFEVEDFAKQIHAQPSLLIPLKNPQFWHKASRCQERARKERMTSAG